jgi:hypothetical protein
MTTPTNLTTDPGLDDYVIVKCLSCAKIPRRPAHYRLVTELYLNNTPPADPCCSLSVLARLSQVTWNDAKIAFDKITSDSNQSNQGEPS